MKQNILAKEEKYKIVGEIYKITNTINNKCYIGQTRSHRLNHNKYRPFGYLGRFKDHINEAYSNKKNQSRYLNSAILKYGEKNFNCILLEECNIEELNDLEIYYIRHYNSKFPNGYNLTDGGKCFIDTKYKLLNFESNYEKINRNITSKTDYTKNLISQQLKNTLNSKEHRNKKMLLSQKQHLKKKYDRFKDVFIDINKIDEYIRVRNNKDKEQYIVIIINNMRITSFVGKFEDIEKIKERAKQFILSVKEWQRNQNAGNSLEINNTTHNLEINIEEHD